MQILQSHHYRFQNSVPNNRNKRGGFSYIFLNQHLLLRIKITDSKRAKYVMALRTTEMDKCFGCYGL